MKTLKDLFWELKIGRKWEKVNLELAMEDVREFERALYMARKAAKIDRKAVKAMHKAIVQATR